MASRSYVIDPSALSHSQLLEIIDEYLSGQPDAAKWKDEFLLATGTTFKELIAGLGTYAGYNSLMALRENSILTAKLKENVYGMADHLGYPLNRVRAPTFKITVNVNTSSYWDRDVPIATLNGEPLSLLESRYLAVGTTLEIDVIMGKWATSTIQPTTSENFQKVIVPFTDLTIVDNDYLDVLVDGTKLQSSKVREDMYTPNTVAISTLVDGIAIHGGSDSLGHKFLQGTNVTIEYVEVNKSKAQDTSSYLLSKLSSTSTNFTITSLDVITPYYPEDSLKKIATLAPAYRAASRNMVEPSSHVSIVKSYAGIHDASYNEGYCINDDSTFDSVSCVAGGNTWDEGKVGCCTSTMSYLFTDEHHLNALETIELLKYVKPFKWAGQGIIFKDPEPVLVNIILNVSILPTANTVELNSLIENFIKDNMTMKLEGTFRVPDIAEYTEGLSGVVRCYTKQPLSDKRLPFYKYFKIGSLEIVYKQEDSSLNTLGSSSSDVGYV